MITFLLLGNKIHRPPLVGELLYFDFCGPSHTELYIARKNSVMFVKTEFFSIVDGGPDLLLPDFELGMIELCNAMNFFDMDIGTTRERINGKNSKYFHHGIVCRTSAFKELHIPEKGCFCFNKLVYSLLSKKGVAVCDVEAYDWIPSVNGAAKWIDLPISKINSSRWLKGLDPIPEPYKAGSNIIK